MTKKDRVKKVLLLLDENYPDKDKCFLNYTKDYELLFATILSAQCTDERVNIVTKDLFAKYISLEEFANAPQEELENDIKSTGFFRNKAKNIILSAKALLERFNGNLPSSIEDLTSLYGVGRKTANVVRSHIFNIASIVVDTHVMRITGRLGLVSSKDPEKIEFALMKILPKEHWIRYNTQVIAFGREICKAQNPKCGVCFMRECCTELNRAGANSK
jgi:endonuclease-3